MKQILLTLCIALPSSLMADIYLDIQSPSSGQASEILGQKSITYRVFNFPEARQISIKFHSAFDLVPIINQSGFNDTFAKWKPSTQTLDISTHGLTAADLSKQLVLHFHNAGLKTIHVSYTIDHIEPALAEVGRSQLPALPTAPIAPSTTSPWRSPWVVVPVMTIATAAAVYAYSKYKPNLGSSINMTPLASADSAAAGQAASGVMTTADTSWWWPWLLFSPE